MLGQISGNEIGFHQFCDDASIKTIHGLEVTSRSSSRFDRNVLTPQGRDRTQPSDRAKIAASAKTGAKIVSCEETHKIVTEIQNSRLLWAKGVLFLVLGIVASWLIVLQAGQFKILVLLAIAVWAFCRAYFFTFYVIEKYADPSFRYRGLLSLLHYVIVKARGKLYVDLESVYENGYVESARTKQRLIYREMIKWFVIATIANLLVPSLFRLLEISSFLWIAIEFDYLMVGLLGFLVAESAFCAVFGTLLDTPAKYRLPISFGVSLWLAIVYIVGIRIMESNQGSIPPELLLIIIVAATLPQSLAVGLFEGYRRITHRQLTAFNSSEVVEAKTSRIGSKQLSLKYILVATTVSAIVLATLKGVGIFQLNHSPGFELAFLILCGLIVFGFLFALALLCVVIVFRPDGQTITTWKFILLLFSIGTFPALTIHAMRSLPNLPGPIGYEAFPTMYVFFVCYVAMLFWVSSRFRSVGLRLQKMERIATKETSNLESFNKFDK